MSTYYNFKKYIILLYVFEFIPKSNDVPTDQYIISDQTKSHIWNFGDPAINKKNVTMIVSGFTELFNMTKGYYHRNIVTSGEDISISFNPMTQEQIADHHKKCEEEAAAKRENH